MISLIPARMARRWRAMSMMETIIVIAIVAVALTAAIGAARGELGRMHVRQTMADLRELVSATGGMAADTGSYRFLGGIGTASTYTAALNGASLVARSVPLSDAMVVTATGTGSAQIRLGGRYPVSLGSGEGCTGACAGLGLNTAGHLFVMVGSNDQPVDDTAVCQALMSFVHPALRSVQIQPATGNTPGLPRNPQALAANNGTSQVLVFASGTTTNSVRLNTRDANLGNISGECSDYEAQAAQTAVILVFSGYNL